MKRCLPLLLALVCGCARDYDSRVAAITDIAEAMCERAARCSGRGIERVESCVHQFVAEECYRGGCAEPPVADDDQIRACVTAIAVMSCADQPWPAQCRGVP